MSNSEKTTIIYTDANDVDIQSQVVIDYTIDECQKLAKTKIANGEVCQDVTSFYLSNN
jgi:hypothetical protein